MGYQSELVGTLPDLEAELRSVEEQVAELEARAQSLRQIVEGIKGLRGPAPASDPQLPGVVPDEGRNEPFYGTPAIRRILEAQPDRTWRVRDVYAALEERGWISPHAQHPKRGLEAAINRMYRTGEIHRVSPGRYRYVGKRPPTSGPAASNGHGEV